MNIKLDINVSVCTPKGFLASGVHCGIRKNKTKKDLSLIYSKTPCTTACVYTTNLVKGAPLKVKKENLSLSPIANAVITNSGNANTCNANGIEIAKQMCELLANELGIKATDVVVASTGVIGQTLCIDPIKEKIPDLVAELSTDATSAVEAIMTTDTKMKQASVSFEIDGKLCSMGIMGKGSGMIHPNMATMLSYITTDINISADMLQKALSDDVKLSYNMISIDGDTSTNDMVAILANGLCGNDEITTEDDNYKLFTKALNMLTTTMAKFIAKDGEGATRLLECNVKNAPTKEDASLVARAITSSSLFKSAVFGADANWGRVLCATGYSGANIDVEKIDVSFSSNKGRLDVCKGGYGVDFSEELAKEILLEEEIFLEVNLNQGDENATAWGCDLTYDYVKINGDYRT